VRLNGQPLQLDAKGDLPGIAGVSNGRRHADVCAGDNYFSGHSRNRKQRLPITDHQGDVELANMETTACSHSWNCADAMPPSPDMPDRERPRAPSNRFAMFDCCRVERSLRCARRGIRALSDIRLRFETIKPQISAIEVSLTLFSAVDKNCLDLATELLDHGASVDARDRLGARPLSHAARFGHLGMVDLLLAHERSGRCPQSRRRHRAVFCCRRRPHAGRAAADRTRRRRSNSPGAAGSLRVAAAAYAGSDAIVEALLAAGADPRAPDETGKPPIVYAAAGAQLDIVKRLLAHNIDINARYPNDLTLLMWASGPG